jgi:hypothetical protein
MSLHKELVAAFRQTEAPEINLPKQDGGPPSGFSWKRVDLALVINSAGELADIDRPPWRMRARRSANALLTPPQQFQGEGGFSGFLWGHSSHVLGIGRGGRGRLRTYPEAFNRFRTFHRAVLGRTESPAIRAFLLFLERWTPESAEQGVAADAVGATLVFRFRYDGCFLHDSHTAQLIWSRLANPGGAPTATADPA